MIILQRFAGVNNQGFVFRGRPLVLVGVVGGDALVGLYKVGVVYGTGEGEAGWGHVGREGFPDVDGVLEGGMEGVVFSWEVGLGGVLG